MLIARAWRTLSRIERTVWAAALVVAVSSFLVGPIARRVAPQIAVDAAAERHDEDPWGRRWCSEQLPDSLPGDPTAYRSTGLFAFVYSAGPNGVDEQGRGDDRYAFYPGAAARLLAWTPPSWTG